ncbi:MAG: deoxyguanosinetriphosphate triphosphohydrolase [Parvularculaceae bacterium]
MNPAAFPGPLAPYASRAEASAGRLYGEPVSGSRTAFQRDRDRVIHSVAFRRLKHKTQVFVAHEGDHYRTRLTHSLEVAQIARAIARQLQLDEDLAEALALAHDLGHSPFGHAGETALDRCMAEFGGFDHNAQTLRILTKLERRYPAFDGLNLTWETLEGVVKHNGPLTGPRAKAVKPPPAAILDYSAEHDLQLESFASLEAQVAAIADDIAYNNHDVDDGLRAELFTLEALRDVPLVAAHADAIDAQYGRLDPPVFVSELVRRLIGEMVEDVVAETRARLAAAGAETAEDVRAAQCAIAGFSAEMESKQQSLRSFLRANMYRHYRVNRAMSQARRIVGDLFELLTSEPDLLAPDWRARCDEPGGARTARAVCDYIAGMTDRYAAALHRRLFNLESWV